MKYCKLYRLFILLSGFLFFASCNPFPEPDIPHDGQDQDFSSRDIQVWEGTFSNTTIGRQDEVQWELLIRGNKVYGMHKTLTARLYGDGGEINGIIFGGRFKADASWGSTVTKLVGKYNGNTISGNYTTENGQKGHFKLIRQKYKTLHKYESSLWFMKYGANKFNSFLQSLNSR